MYIGYRSSSTEPAMLHRCVSTVSQNGQTPLERMCYKFNYQLWIKVQVEPPVSTMQDTFCVLGVLGRRVACYPHGFNPFVNVWLYMLYIVHTHRGVTVQVSEKLNPLSDADIKINRWPDGAAHIHTQLAYNLYHKCLRRFSLSRSCQGLQ